MAEFPIDGVAQTVEERYFVPGGKDGEVRYRLVPKATIPLREDHVLLLALANFVEVFLAKAGHDGLIGINYLEKVRLPHLPSLYGAMLAGVDYVLMGAGIPREIPGALDALAEGRKAALTIPIEGTADRETVTMELDPRDLAGDGSVTFKRPYFLAIVSSCALARSLKRRANGKVDGFVIEGPSAGGHNAPPRGKLQLDDRGEPIYGPRDEVDLEQFAQIGEPFWIAGSTASAITLREVVELGGQGVQIGTAFALCKESGYAESIRLEILRQIESGAVDVRADARASPTGFPFRVVQLEGSLSDREVYGRRRRICDLGYLRSPYRRDDGRIGFRCAAEPESAYLRKGGSPADLEDRKCLCNGLLANTGMPQVRATTGVTGRHSESRNPGVELPIVTTGTDYRLVRSCLAAKGTSYSAVDVIEALLQASPQSETVASAAGSTGVQARRDELDPA
jgi:nitronate monooxygenase